MIDDSLDSRLTRQLCVSMTAEVEDGLDLVATYIGVKKTVLARRYIIAGLIKDQVIPDRAAIKIAAMQAKREQAVNGGQKQV